METIEALRREIERLEQNLEIERAASRKLLEEREDYYEKFNWEAERNEPLREALRAIVDAYYAEPKPAFVWMQRNRNTIEAGRDLLAGEARPV